MKIINMIKEAFKILKLNKYMALTLLPLFVFATGLYTYEMIFIYKNRGVFDLTVALLITILGLLLLGFIASHMFDGLKQLPSGVMFYGGVSLAMLMILFRSNRTPNSNIIAVIAIGLLFISFGNMIYHMLFKKEAKLWIKLISHLLFIISIVSVVVLFVWTGVPTQVEDYAFKTYKTNLSIKETQALYKVVEGVYGNEDYLEKYPMVNQEISDTTGISYFLNSWNKTRENYLGFNVYNVPLNAHYYMPESPGNYPVLVLVHGNHEMSHDSEIGYGYLGRYLASRGYVVVSVDENFLNYSSFDSKLMQQSLGNENDARAYVLLRHVSMILDKSLEADSIFYNKINKDQIALMGHSRGGEAVAIASFFNQIKYLPNNYNKRFEEDFKIKSVIAVAPTDKQYKPAGKLIELTDVNYLLLHGSHDMDVTYMAGLNQYDRINYSNEDSYFKSAVYIYGANHGYFNETWHKGDTSPISGMLHNTRQLIERKTQEEIASQLIYSFLEASLKEDAIQRKGFENLKSFTDLPENLYVSQYHESGDLVIVDYSEDNYLETGTLEGTILSSSGLNKWYESSTRLDGKSSNVYGAYLGWNKKSESSYQLDIMPKAFKTEDILYLTIADDTVDNEENINFKIRLEDTNGQTSDVFISEYGYLQHQIEINLPKLYMFEDINNREAMYQTIQLPLILFENKNSQLNLSDISKISLVFENGDNQIIILKDLGIRRVD